jgi:hypothetical protein
VVAGGAGKQGERAVGVGGDEHASPGFYQGGHGVSEEDEDGAGGEEEDGEGNQQKAAALGGGPPGRWWGLGAWF